MFFDKTFISNLLKCQQCEQQYDDYDQPRMLPCGKTLCSKCISKIESQIFNNSFTCILCDEKHSLNSEILQRFPVNELAVNLIAAQPRDVYRGRETEAFKKNLLNLEKLLSELSFDMENGADKIKTHCSELKRLTQLSTENKINELNVLNGLFIKQIDEYEKSCIENISLNSEKLLTLPLKEVVSEANKFLNEKRQYLDQFQINELEIISSNEKLNQIKLNLEEQLLNVKSFLFENNLMEFEINKNKLEKEVLGYFRFNKLYSTKNKIISGSDDNLIKVWDLNSGECLKTLYAHSGEVNCIEMISNEKLVSGSSDKTLKLWDLNSYECILTLYGHTDWVNCVQKLNDNQIISGSGDQTIKVWNLLTGLCCNTLEGNGSAMCIQLLSDERIICGYDDWTIKVWDLAANDCLKVLEGHSDQVWMLIKYSNEKIISASADKTIKIWNIETEECLKTLKSHTGLVYWIEIISNERIASCSHDKTIKIWNLETGNCLKTLRGHSGPVDCIKKIANDRIVSCSVDNSVKIWDICSGECLSTLTGHNDEVNCVVTF